MTAIATVTSDSLHVRGVPHKEGEVVGYLKKGDRVVVLERKAFGPYVWLKVKMPKGEGWVYSPHVTVASNVPDLEPPHIPVPDTNTGLAKWIAGGMAVVIIILIWAFR